MTDKKGLLIDVSEEENSVFVSIDYYPIHREEGTVLRDFYRVNRGETLTITYELKMDKNGNAEGKVVNIND